MSSSSSPALPILQSLPEGGSGTGLSYYSQAISCARRGFLDAQAKQDGASRSDSGDGANLGTVFHALCDIYYTHNVPEIVVELPDINLATVADEARRAFVAYTERFKPSDFKRVVATEMLLPKDEQQAAIIRAVSTITSYTMRIDLVVEVDERSADILYKKRGLIIPEPGIYLWDYKTGSSKGKNDDLEYRFKPQFAMYQAVWNALYPDKPCKGMVADRVITGFREGKPRKRPYEDGDFYSILVPPPDPAWLAAVQETLRLGEEMSKRQERNTFACFDWGRACPHLLNGACANE